MSKLIKGQGEMKRIWEDSISIYSRENNKVLYNNKIINNADAGSFIPLDGYYALDKTSVYCRGEKIDLARDSFHFVRNSLRYVTDENDIFLGCRPLSDIDVKTFIGMSGKLGRQGYAQDKNHMSFIGKIVNGTGDIVNTEGITEFSGKE